MSDILNEDHNNSYSATLCGTDHGPSTSPTPAIENQCSPASCVLSTTAHRFAVASVFFTTAVMGIISIVHQQSGWKGWVTSESQMSLGKTYEFENVYQYCDEYDDDTVFNYTLCHEKDAVMCGLSGDDDDFRCMESHWCSILCGESCLESKGALCFYDTLVDMKSTCSKVNDIIASEAEDIKTRHQSVAGDNLRIRSFGDVHSVGVGLGEGYGPHFDVSDLGCGTHAFCEYCSDDCNSTKMSVFAEQYVGLELASQINPQYAKYIIINIEAACDYFGFLVSAEGQDGVKEDNDSS